MNERLFRRQADIIAQYELFDDWLDKYQQIIHEGKRLPPLDAQYHTDPYLVRGCQSQVWFYHEVKAGHLVFHAASESSIVQGLLALLIRVYSDATPQEILATPPEFIQKMGLDAHLSPTRQTGLHAVLAQMFKIAETQCFPVGTG